VNLIFIKDNIADLDLKLEVEGNRVSNIGNEADKVGD